MGINPNICRSVCSTCGLSYISVCGDVKQNEPVRCVANDSSKRNILHEADKTLVTSLGNHGDGPVQR